MRPGKKSVFTEWSLQTTCQCYPKIFQTDNNLLKVTWALVFLTFSGVTAWLTIKCLVDYLEYDVVSKIRVFSEKPVEFPTVTVCDGIFHSRLVKRFISDSPQNLSFKDKYTYLVNEINILEAYVRTQNLSDAHKRGLGMDFPMILSCLFNSQQCENASDAFRWFYSYYYGNCYQFNSGLHGAAVRSTQVESKWNGIRLLIGPLIRADTHLNGVYVLIHNRSVSLDISPLNEEFFADVGKETNIALARRFTYMQPYPYSNCNDMTEFDSEMYRFFLASNRTYRQKACLDTYTQKFYIDKCHCIYPGLPNPYRGQTFDTCMNVSQVKCMLDVYSMYMDQNKEISLSECPLECDSMAYASVLTKNTMQGFEDVYDLFMGDASLMSMFRANLNGSLTLERFRTSVVSLNVFYPSLKYTEIREMPKTSLIDLISNMGGALGVFLGFTVFSLVETLEIAIKLVYVYILRK